MAIRDQHFTATHNPAAINGSARKLHCKSKVIEIDEDDDDESGAEYAEEFRTFLLTHPELAHLKPQIDPPIEMPPFRKACPPPLSPLSQLTRTYFTQGLPRNPNVRLSKSEVSKEVHLLPLKVPGFSDCNGYMRITLPTRTVRSTGPSFSPSD
jgi:hypothetical protein